MAHKLVDRGDEPSWLANQEKVQSHPDGHLVSLTCWAGEETDPKLRASVVVELDRLNDDPLHLMMWKCVK